MPSGMYGSVGSISNIPVKDSSKIEVSCADDE